MKNSTDNMTIKKGDIVAFTGKYSLSHEKYSLPHLAFSSSGESLVWGSTKNKVLLAQYKGYCEKWIDRKDLEGIEKVGTFSRGFFGIEKKLSYNN